MQPQHQNYTRNVVANQEEALSKIVAKVPRGALVLDVGCGSGMMGRFLSENNECVVDGVDIDPEAVELARPKYRNIAVANLERDSLMAFFKPSAYDCIVVADVVEHLVHPEQLFEDIKKLLKPEGMLLFSIPNISHISAGLELILGKFGYQNSGLLDSTHVRFYSRQGFVDKLASSGIYVEDIDTVQRDFDKTEFPGYQHFPQHWVRDIIASRDDALTYQWIMTARLFNSAVAKTRTVGQGEIDARHISLSARAYWRSAFDDSFSEANAVPGTVRLNSTGEPVMDFDFSEANCRYPLIALRVDLVSDDTAFVFEEAALTSAQHQTLWATRKLGQGELVNAMAIAAPACDAVQGTAVLPEDNDPQWYPPLGEAVLSAIGPGAKLRVSMNVLPDGVLPIMRAAFTARAAELAERTASLADTQALLQAKITEAADVTKLNPEAHEGLLAKAAAADHLQRLAMQTGESLLAKTAEIAQLHAALNQERTAMSSAQAETRDLQARLAQQQIALVEQAHHLQTTQAHYAQALNSLSWRLTKPLRWARRQLR